MKKAGKAGAPWRSWTIVALVLVALALAQACSDSSNRTTGPTKTTAVALKVHRAAQIPAGCKGTLVVSGPNGFRVEVDINPSGEASFPAPIGVPLTLTVILDCGAQGTFTGSTSFTAGPGNNQAAVTVVATQAGVSCSPGTVAPGQPSNCVCTIKSPTPPSVTWTGSVSPTTGLSTTFSNSTPGTYTVTCTVNNATSASTTVTVQAPPSPPEPPPPPQTATAIVIQNNDGTLNLQAIFTSGPQAVPTINSLPPGQSATRNVQAGTYNVQILFDNDGFLDCTTDSITVNTNQMQTRGYMFPESCGG